MLNQYFEAFRILKEQGHIENSLPLASKSFICSLYRDSQRLGVSPKLYSYIKVRMGAKYSHKSALYFRIILYVMDYTSGSNQYVSVEATRAAPRKESAFVRPQD